MRRALILLLTCTLFVGGLWFAPGFSGAAGPTDPEPDPARRGTAVQVEPTAPSPDGTGRRVIYSKFWQTVWVVEESGEVVRQYRVSGRYDQPDFGTYYVWSKSMYTCNTVHPDICMRYMVRFAHGPNGGNIGFHEIPVWNGRPLQTNEMLGRALSDGCVRQSTADAMFMWEWAQVGTKVVVVP